MVKSQRAEAAVPQLAPPAHGATGSVKCLANIRRMILTGQLLPGQKIHQDELAAQLGVSRIPVREALSTLQAEGVVVHRPQTGYTVARFSSEDLSEIYLMRRLLETELLRSFDLHEVDVDELEELNRYLSTLTPDEQPDEYQSINRRFHFRLFEYSPLTLVRDQVARLWYMASFYHSLWLHETNSAHQGQLDHERILAALRTCDLEELIKASDDHRAGTEQTLIQRIGRSRPR